MTARERVARDWHAGSGHVYSVPFGEFPCDCDQVAGRIMPMLRQAWRDGAFHGWKNGDEALTTAVYDHNPYESEEGHHVDQ